MFDVLIIVIILLCVFCHSLKEKRVAVLVPIPLR